MNDKFDNFMWHDAILKSIFIDRRNPGQQDSVTILVEWPGNMQSSLLEFYDCYALSATMNFGVIASESILEATCVTDSQEIQNLRKKWKNIGVDINHLNCYRIVTNSTNSIIEIYSKGFLTK